MANTLLTVDQITKEALRILHQKLTFIGSIDRQFDNQFGKEGAKIGSTLRVRMPVEYSVSTGSALSTQDTTETYVNLTVSTQKHVDTTFSSAELTMSLDMFSNRILQPAMSRLAAAMEADALTMRNSIYNIVDNDAAAMTYRAMLDGGNVLNQYLAPLNDRSFLLSGSHNATVLDAAKALFNDQSAISKQYREGVMAHVAGFDILTSSLVTPHLTGTAVKTTTYLVDETVADGASTIHVDTGTTTFKAGDIVTFADVYPVHPETHETVTDMGLKTFVITEDYAGDEGDISISPTMYDDTVAARQNVSALPADDAAVTKVAAAANEYYDGSIAYQKEAFTFATAPLVMPKGVDFASRQTYDGISLRVIRDYDISTDNFPVRIDVYYGYACLRPQLACRIHADG